MAPGLGSLDQLVPVLVTAGKSFRLHRCEPLSLPKAPEVGCGPNSLASLSLQEQKPFQPLGKGWCCRWTRGVTASSVKAAFSRDQLIAELVLAYSVANSYTDLG